MAVLRYPKFKIQEVIIPDLYEDYTTSHTQGGDELLNGLEAKELVLIVKG